jgi:microcystin degradation protein MlrC
MATFNVLSAELQHETNTFCKLATHYESFDERSLLMGEQAIAARQHHNTALAGFMDAANAHGWQLQHVISADAAPGGRVSQDAFDRLTTPIISAIKSHAGKLDGIILGLHGAMCTEHSDDGEGDLLELIRQSAGFDVPIAITLDPHAHVTRKMCDLAQIMVCFKTYPHVDMRIAGRQAADILQCTMQGEIQPRTLRVARPMLEEASGGRTDMGAMIERIARARAYEREPEVFAVSVNGGFPNADIEELGPTVLVTAQGDMTAHARFASELADDIWAKRAERLEVFHTTKQAAEICKTYSSGQDSRPIVVADYADNPGGGAYGDSTALLKALLDAGVQNACFGPMVDSETVQLLWQHQIGDQVAIRLGGKTDTRFGGEPLVLQCTLRLLSDGKYTGSGAMIGGLERSWGPTAVISVGGIDILVTTQRTQILDLQQFKTFGIHPEQKRVIALKSMQHFRAEFEAIAGQVIVCDSGALCTLDYARLPFEHVPRPIFPLDASIQIEPWLAANQQGIYIPKASNRGQQPG